MNKVERVINVLIGVLWGVTLILLIAPAYVLYLLTLLTEEDNY